MPRKKHKFGDFFKDGDIHPKYKDSIEEHSEKKEKIGVFAVHGGNIDSGTEDIVHYVADNSQASKYVFSPKGQSHDDKTHHVTSTKITHTHSNKLKDIMDHCETGISVHGHSKTGEHENRVYVGGDHDYLRKKIGESLQKKLGEDYEVIYDPKKIPKDLRGTSKDRTKGVYNFVNKMGEKGGVQIELPANLRKNKQHQKIVGDVLKEIIDNEYKPQEKYNAGDQKAA